MHITYFQALNLDFNFTALVETISKALSFLDPADVGPWVQK